MKDVYKVCLQVAARLSKSSGDPEHIDTDHIGYATEIATSLAERAGYTVAVTESDEARHVVASRDGETVWHLVLRGVLRPGCHLVTEPGYVPEPGTKTYFYLAGDPTRYRRGRSTAKDPRRLGETLRRHSSGRWSAVIHDGPYCYYGWTTPSEHPIHAYHFQTRVDMRRHNASSEVAAIEQELERQLGSQVAYATSDIPPMPVHGSRYLIHVASYSVREAVEWLLSHDLPEYWDRLWSDYLAGYGELPSEAPLWGQAEFIYMVRGLDAWENRARNGIEHYRAAA